MSSTQFHGKDTNVQTGGLESHRWLDTHKRSIIAMGKKDSNSRYGQIFPETIAIIAEIALSIAIITPMHKYIYVYLRFRQKS